MLIPSTSPLHSPPASLSRRQVVILDGIRYAIEMAHIAYERLDRQLQGIGASFTDTKPQFDERATAMLDAWSIVDSAHRMADLVTNLPGLPNSTWKRLFQDRTSGAAELRDCVQHQLGEIDGIISNGGQLWGYLSWAEFRNGKHTGNG